MKCLTLKSMTAVKQLSASLQALDLADASEKLNDQMREAVKEINSLCNLGSELTMAAESLRALGYTQEWQDIVNKDNQLFNCINFSMEKFWGDEHAKAEACQEGIMDGIKKVLAKIWEWIQKLFYWVLDKLKMIRQFFFGDYGKKTDAALKAAVGIGASFTAGWAQARGAKIAQEFKKEHDRIANEVAKLNQEMGMARSDEERKKIASKLSAVQAKEDALLEKFNKAKAILENAAKLIDAPKQCSLPDTRAMLLCLSFVKQIGDAINLQIREKENAFSKRLMEMETTEGVLDALIRNSAIGSLLKHKVVSDCIVIDHATNHIVYNAAKLPVITYTVPQDMDKLTNVAKELYATWPNEVAKCRTMIDKLDGILAARLKDYKGQIDQINKTINVTDSEKAELVKTFQKECMIMGALLIALTQCTQIVSTMDSQVASVAEVISQMVPSTDLIDQKLDAVVTRDGKFR